MKALWIDFVQPWPLRVRLLRYGLLVVGALLLGLVFLFFPLIASATAVIFGGVLLVIFAFGLFGWAWRLYQRSKA